MLKEYPLGGGGGCKNSSWKCFKMGGGVGSKCFFKIFPALRARKIYLNNFSALRAGTIYPQNFSGVPSRRNVYLILDANLYRYKMYGTGNSSPNLRISLKLKTTPQVFLTGKSPPRTGAFHQNSRP